MVLLEKIIKYLDLIFIKSDVRFRNKIQNKDSDSGHHKYCPTQNIQRNIF